MARALDAILLQPLRGFRRRQDLPRFDTERSRPFGIAFVANQRPECAMDFSQFHEHVSLHLCTPLPSFVQLWVDVDRPRARRQAKLRTCANFQRVHK